MSAIKREFFDLTHQGIPARSSPSLPSLPSPGSPGSPGSLPFPRHVFILTMNGKPLSVYYSLATAHRDMETLRQGDARDGYHSTYALQEMGIDYTL